MRIHNVEFRINAVMNGTDSAHALFAPLEVADTDKIDRGVMRIKIAEHRKVGMMNGVDEGQVYELAAGKSRAIVQVYDVAIGRSITNGPGSVMHIFQIVVELALDRPLRLSVDKAQFRIDGGFSVGVN